MSEGYSQAPTHGLPGRMAIHGQGNPHDAHSHAHHPKLQHHFDDMAQQAEASTLGMWVFLVTEIMFFGGLFMAYLLYRWKSPEGFAEASNHLDVIWGAANTVVKAAEKNVVKPVAKPSGRSPPRRSRPRRRSDAVTTGGGWRRPRRSSKSDLPGA